MPVYRFWPVHRLTLHERIENSNNFKPENLHHLGGRTNNYILIYILLSFILFRFFDILKPYPINIVDKKMKNGVGVMLDDIIAGIYSTIVIYIIYALWF